MPSQDDYLKGLMKEDEESGGLSAAPDLDALADMSEEEIAAYLEAGNAEEPPVLDEIPEDVLDMPESDSDVQEIQNLLRKSDRNETVDSRGGFPEEENQAEKLLAEIENVGETEVAESAVDSKKAKALEKKRLKEEKKAAKAAARAEKSKKRKKDREAGGQQQKQERSLPESSSSGTVEEFDMVRDRDILDSIVQEAEKVETREQPEVDLMEVAAALDAERHVDPSEEIPYDSIEDTLTEDSSGVIALDLDEVDDYIPDISKPDGDEDASKKKGVLSRFINFLMEEEPENEDVQISEENQEIIREMDKEESQKAKKKVQKKAKKKEKAKKEKKPKAAKPPKPKKEKKPREADPYPVKKLSFKKVLPILILGASLGAAIFIFAALSIDYAAKQTAQTAFDNGDYQTCFASLHGKKLSEAEEIMYGKSQSILHIRMWYQEYLYLASQGGGPKALDSLIQNVHEYPVLYEYASRWGAQAEVGEIYNSLLSVMYEEFGVTEEQAREIAALKSDIDYTRAVLALAGEDSQGDDSGENGYETESPGEDNEAGQVEADGEGEESGVQQGAEDELPEESELEEGDFVDNQ